MNTGLTGVCLEIGRGSKCCFSCTFSTNHWAQQSGAPLLGSNDYSMALQVTARNVGLALISGGLAVTETVHSGSSSINYTRRESLLRLRCTNTSLEDTGTSWKEPRIVHALGKTTTKIVPKRRDSTYGSSLRLPVDWYGAT